MKMHTKVFFAALLVFILLLGLSAAALAAPYGAGSRYCGGQRERYNGNRYSDGGYGDCYNGGGCRY